MSSLRAAPGESARQFAAAQAAARRRGSSGEELEAIARVKPARAASPQPTVERGWSRRAGAKRTGEFFAAEKSRPSALRLIAALRAPRDRSRAMARAADSLELMGKSSSADASSRFG